MPSRPATSDRPLGAAVSPLAYPLDEFYAQARKPLPEIASIPGEIVPEPYKSLLVHTNDMTPTLESFYRHPVHLEVLRSQQRDDLYFREVVLHLDGSDAPVEFGAIKINLALFPAAARREILEEKTPLGHILRHHQIAHTCRPRAFLRVTPDDLIGPALKLSGGGPLFGRRNSLADPSHRSLAEVVEILSPIARSA